MSTESGIRPPVRSRGRMELRVGALVLVSLVTIIVFIGFLGDFSFGPVKRLNVDFDNTGGLQKGAPVMMSGVEIGKVAEIKLLSGKDLAGPNGRKLGVRITAEIPPDAFSAIPSNTIASVGSRNMLGEKHLELTPANPPGDPIPEDAILDGRPPMRLEKAGDDAMALFRQLSKFMNENGDKLTETVTQIHQLSTDANDFLKVNRPKLDSTIDNLQKVSQELADEVSKDGRISKVIGKADRIMTRLDGATAGIDKDLPDMVQKISTLSGKADKLVTDMGGLVGKIAAPASSAVADISSIAADANQGKGTMGKLLKSQELYDELLAFIKDIKAHPAKLLFKR